jgi:hypothetical protein
MKNTTVKIIISCKKMGDDVLPNYGALFILSMLQNVVSS